MFFSNYNYFYTQIEKNAKAVIKTIYKIFQF